LREANFCARSGWDVDVIVVDNSGTYQPLVHDPHGRVRVIKPRSNLGYAGGIALGTAALSKADYYLLINNDVEVLEGSLCRLLEAHLSLPNIGALQPLVLNYDGSCCDSIGSAASPLLNGYGYHDNWLGNVRIAGAGELRALEIFGVEGMAIFISNANWRRYRWDPEFFMFNEDGLLNLRLRLAGLSNYVVLGAKVRHLRGASAEGHGLKRDPIFPSFYTMRNRLLSMLYVYSAPELLIYLPLSITFELVKSIYLSARSRSTLHAYYSVMALWHLLKGGSRIRALRRLMTTMPRRNSISSLVRSGYMISAARGLAEILRDLLKGEPI
jgi:GT2 family glycosyltransferase